MRNHAVDRAVAHATGKKEITFKVSKEERELIIKIAARANEAGKDAKITGHTRMDWEMDITAAHANGNPLRLQELLDATKMDFAHDVFGIRKYLNRTTGELTDNFRPRFTAKKEA